jgi:hypothetical protein
VFKTLFFFEGAMNTKKNSFHEERRCTIRHPYPGTVSFTALGNSHNPPNDIDKPADIIDISDDGMRIRISDLSLREGSMIKVRVPIRCKNTAIPVLAEVRWVKEQMPQYCQAGLRFLPI